MAYLAHKIKWRDFLDFRETKDSLIKIVHRSLS